MAIKRPRLRVLSSGNILFYIEVSEKRITNIDFFNFKSKKSCDKYIDNNKSAICWTSFDDMSNSGKRKENGNQWFISSLC